MIFWILVHSAISIGCDNIHLRILTNIWQYNRLIKRSTILTNMINSLMISTFNFIDLQFQYVFFVKTLSWWLLRLLWRTLTPSSNTGSTSSSFTILTWIWIDSNLETKVLHLLHGSLNLLFYFTPVDEDVGECVAALAYVWFYLVIIWDAVFSLRFI